MWWRSRIMGIFQSIRTRSPDEEEGGGGSLVAHPNVQNEYRSNEESILVSIYKATKAILQKALSVIVSTKSADPSSLPIQNPLLAPTPQICSLSVDTVGSLTGDEQAQFENVDHVVSVPEIGCSSEIEVGISPFLEINSSRKSKEKVKSVEINSSRKSKEKVKRSFEVKALSVIVSTKPANPSSLPIQKPLLAPTPQICSRGDSSSHSLSVDTVGSLTGDEQAQFENVDHVVSVPEIGCSSEIEVGISPCLEESVEINSSRKSKEKVKRSLEVKRIKHYSSWHKILLVGEGDFSFSACLALAFGSAANIIATSLDSQAFLKEHYRNAMSNIQELRRRKGKVMHEINATKMANHELLGQLKFDRIIYNFPYAGIFGKSMPKESQLRRHRKLVSKFLMNAKNMLSENGEIHITHKTNCFHADFMIESIASSHGLRLIEAVEFSRGDYPGYKNKYGFGGDRNFDCKSSKTFKFGLKSISL